MSARASRTTQRTDLAGRWRVRTGTSTAAFSVRDKMVTTVHGTLPVVAGEVEVAPDGTVRSAYVELAVAGIATGNAKRDTDLRKPSFLDVEGQPVIRAATSQVTATADGWTAHAELHARGRSAPVELAVAVEGEDDLRIRVTGRLDRAPLGIKAPSFIVGRFVDLDCTLVLHR